MDNERHAIDSTASESCDLRSKSSLSALLPCPFCGGQASTGTIKYHTRSDIVRLNGQHIFHFANCIECGANNQGLIGHKTKEVARLKWNSRLGGGCSSGDCVGYGHICE